MPIKTEFSLPKDGYLVFDSLSMKQFIKDRLNETGVFTDQNYEGSYISTVNEIIAYTFNVLMYYLNRTATEGQFSEAQIYENMNRIVKLIDYKPIGKQTATLNFLMSAGPSFSEGLYTIPRYSYIENGTQTYSFNEDIVFAKTEPINVAQELTDITTQKLVYQGRYREFEPYIATGNDNEIIFFAPGKDVIIDHFNIDVYVYQDNVWKQWKKVSSLYLENAFSVSYEIRLNENKQYELKFGNNINGKKLNVNDKVVIYYLESDGKNGELGTHALKGKNVIPFSTSQFTEIMNSLNLQSNNELVFLDTAQSRNIIFDNNNISTYFQEEEGIDAIRNNAPSIFRTQYRLITDTDYENYLKTNFADLIHDVKAVNNWSYLTEQLKYYYDLGITDPNNVTNVLYNQVTFADSCNFNNIYITIVPKTITDSKNLTSNLTPAQKELITSNIESIKTLTSEVVLIDPVYIASDICLSKDGIVSGNIEDIDKTQLYIIKDSNAKRNNNAIIQDIYNVFVNYFSRNNRTLGGILDINLLTNNIISVPGVKTFYTRRTDNSLIKYQGLSMLMWNPIYTNNKELVTKNVSLSYFKYLYLNNISNLVNKITIESDPKVYESIEY